MKESRRRDLTRAFVTLALSGGCTVVPPPGYAELTETTEAEKIVATPLRMFGCAPWSYDLPDGGQAVVASNAGDDLLDDAFAFRVSTAGVSLRCEANRLGARLRCRGSDEPAIQLELGAASGCAELDRIAFSSRASCWQGVVRVGDTSFPFSYGTVESFPFNQVAWLDSNGIPTFAYDGVVEMQVTLHRGPPAQATRTGDALTASALALHYWSHTTFCD
ncbi:MAG: hypothetical protein JNL21_20980 [Myxococcales bacterium]|nr:hypothetical protein [Myxococcales bacterium]